MKNLSTLILAAIIGLLIVGVGLGFLFGFDNPVPWILIGILVLITVAYNTLSNRKRTDWCDDCSVGIGKMDDDHKKLFELIDKFQTAYEFETGKEFERQVLDDLVEYTKYHFQREEAILQENAYPDYEAHRKEHEAMIGQVGKFIQEYDERGHEALYGVAQYLRGWLVNHIKGTDKRYTSFLNEKGVS